MIFKTVNRSIVYSLNIEIPMFHARIIKMSELRISWKKPDEIILKEMQQKRSESSKLA
jgi:hypothetical protein